MDLLAAVNEAKDEPVPVGDSRPFAPCAPATPLEFRLSRDIFRVRESTGIKCTEDNERCHSRIRCTAVAMRIAADTLHVHIDSTSTAVGEEGTGVKGSCALIAEK